MNIDKVVMAYAGVMILLSIALAHLVHMNWLWLAVFIGANLLQAAFTGFCSLARLLRAMGQRPGAAIK